MGEPDPAKAHGLESDPAKARATARKHTRRYLPLSNYTNNLRRFGFSDTDFDGEGSDRLVDAIVAWGSPEALVRRAEDQWNAGADHVCFQVVHHDARSLPMRALEVLSDALGLNEPLADCR